MKKHGSCWWKESTIEVNCREEQSEKYVVDCDVLSFTQSVCIFICSFGISSHVKVYTMKMTTGEHLLLLTEKMEWVYMLYMLISILYVGGTCKGGSLNNFIKVLYMWKDTFKKRLDYYCSTYVCISAVWWK